MLREEVIKREVLEGGKADHAKRLLSRAANRALRERRQDAASADAALPPARPAAG